MGPYATQVRKECEAHDSLQHLRSFLSRPSLPPGQPQSRIGCIDYFNAGNELCQVSSITNLTQILVDITANIAAQRPGIAGHALVIEDIQPTQVEQLGETLNITPGFFDGYLGTELRNIEQYVLPAYATALPSESASKEELHINYQRVVKLGSTLKLSKGDVLSTSANVTRTVKQISSLKDVSVALVRGCCSVLRKRYDSGFWVCVVLVDRTSSKIVPKQSIKTFTTTTPFQIPFSTDNANSEFSYTTQTPLQVSTKVSPSAFDILMASGVHSPAFDASQPSILSLSYQPLRIGLHEWNTYSLTMSRYVKHYEYSLKKLQLHLREDDIHELQAWRRRAFQSLQKLTASRAFTEHWNQQEKDREPGNWIVKDIQHISSAIESHSHSLETMIPIATSLFQLIDIRRSMEEAIHVKQLTYLALVFIPLSYVSSLFSMSERVAPWSSEFWLYFAVAVPLCLLVLGLSWWMTTFKNRFLLGKRIQGANCNT